MLIFLKNIVQYYYFYYNEFSYYLFDVIRKNILKLKIKIFLVFFFGFSEPGLLGSTSSGESNGAGSSKSFVPCKVCGDKASGYHYGVTSCEGCKVSYINMNKNNQQ